MPPLESSSSLQLLAPNGQSEFQEILRSNPKTLVMFSSPTCTPCNSMKPLLLNILGVAQSLPIAVVDITKLPEIGNQFRVRSLPTLMLFKGEAPDNTHIGSMNFTALRRFAGV